MEAIGDFSPGWIRWFLSMIFSWYIVYEFPVGIAPSLQASIAYLQPRDPAGSYGELEAIGDLSAGWTCWFVSMISSCYTVHEPPAGIASATAQ